MNTIRMDAHYDFICSWPWIDQRKLAALLLSPLWSVSGLTNH